MIIITGGIGCGKSAVSRLLRVMGYNVYDCDREARQLMLHDPLLRQQLQETFGLETYLPDGTLNRPYLSSQIFNHPDKLQTMNSLVHPAVARDIRNVAKEKSNNTLFVETAIYFESGFCHLIETEQVWCVAAPTELCIHRAMLRDKAPREAIEARINNQLSQEKKIALSDAVIWNDGEHSIIEQVNALLTQDFRQ